MHTMRAGQLLKLQPATHRSSSRCLSTRATPNIDRRHLLSGLGLAGLAVAGSQTKAASASTVVPVSTGAAAAMQGFKALQFETTPSGLERVVYDKAGWNWWDWQGHKVHYAVAGPEDAPPVVLVHGYGACAYHWRYNIPALAQKYRVYAICLLGFGWSEKALVDYTNGKQWIAQISDFIEQIVGRQQPVVLAGNSLGGYASLATAAARPDLVRAVALLNGAGPISDPNKPDADPDEPEPPLARLQNWMMGLVKRVVLYFAFIRAKQPERIREVLELVYVNKNMIDDELVDSIVQPATDPQASEVFFRINHRSSPPITVNRLLEKLKAPLLLLWGTRDPWITVSRAVAVRNLYPSAELVQLPSAGHCPHDDTPAEANAALLKWIDQLPQASIIENAASQAASQAA